MTGGSASAVAADSGSSTAGSASAATASSSCSMTSSTSAATAVSDSVGVASASAAASSGSCAAGGDSTVSDSSLQHNWDYQSQTHCKMSTGFMAAKELCMCTASDQQTNTSNQPKEYAIAAIELWPQTENSYVPCHDDWLLDTYSTYTVLTEYMQF